MYRLLPLALIVACNSEDEGRRGDQTPPSETHSASTTSETTTTSDTTDTDTKSGTLPAAFGACSDPYLFTCPRITDQGLLAQCTAGVVAIAGGQTYADLGNAIDSGAQTVLVCPGVHELERQLTNRTLAMSAIDMTPESTVITGATNHQILVAGNSTIALEGLAFCHGRSGYDGGAIEISDSDLDIPCGAFVGNIADYEGGALRIRAGRTTIGDVEFRHNYADYGGGAIQAADWSPTRLEMDGTRFINNEADYAGGALAVGSWADDVLVFNNVDFTNNRAGYEGGAMQLGGWEGVDLTATGGTWDGNTAPNGGVVEIGSRSPRGLIFLDTVTITSNTSTSGAFILQDDLTLECVSCDWGVGLTDNSQSDLVGHGQNLMLGTNETFTLP